MATNVVEIRPAMVPESARFKGFNTVRRTLASPTSDLPMGTPVVLSSGAVAAPTLGGSGNVFVTNANTLYGVTNEPYTASLRVSGAVPIRQTDVGLTVLMGGAVPIEMNMYYDGDADSDDAPEIADIGTEVVVKKLTNGIYVVDPDTSTSGLATFIVVDLIDEPGTVYGRVLVVPSVSYRLIV